VNPLPAIIKSYDPDRRTVRISVPGMTDGADMLPEAQICYSIGDDYNFTEIQINTGIPVWIDFIGGDPRFPLVIGWRTPQEGNANGWRKWRHANIEAIAQQVLKLIAGSEMQFQVGGSTVTIVDGAATVDVQQTTFTGAVTVEGLFTFQSGMNGSGGAGGDATMTITGNTNFIGSVMANGKHIDDTHEHTSNPPGAPTSPPIN
jgi:phage baseplate assembly protein gpV